MTYVFHYSALLRKKEKIANCMALTNGISPASVKAAPQVLNLSIETLLCLCDDSDSDVRTVADECLNKIIRVSSSINIFSSMYSIFVFHCKNISDFSY